MALRLKDELRRLAALGHTANEAARLAGCKVGAARMAAERHGFRFVREAERRDARIAELARAGRTANEIAAALGTGRHNVYRVLKQRPDLPRPTTLAQRAKEAAAREKAAEEAARMERWRAAWASRKAAQDPAPASPASVLDEASLGDAMRRLVAAERGRRSA